jgi:hypothetical protein
MQYLTSENISAGIATFGCSLKMQAYNSLAGMQVLIIISHMLQLPTQQ